MLDLFRIKIAGDDEEESGRGGGGGAWGGEAVGPKSTVHFRL